MLLLFFLVFFLILICAVADVLKEGYINKYEYYGFFNVAGRANNIVRIIKVVSFVICLVVIVVKFIL